MLPNAARSPYWHYLTCLERAIRLTFFLSFAVEGILKGYDQLLNLVLDETVEYLRGEQSLFSSADVLNTRAPNM